MRFSAAVATACVLLMISGSAFSNFHAKKDRSSSAGESSSSSAGDGSSGSILDLFTLGTTATKTFGQDTSSENENPAEAYDGPRARIVVKRITDKTGAGWYKDSIGDAMAEQLAAALVNSNRFILLDRDALNDILDEQDLLADSDRVDSATVAPRGQIEGAELIVTGAVTEFEPGPSDTDGSADGSLLGNALGAIFGGVKSARMAIDIRVIDVRTSRIVVATRAEGKAADIELDKVAGAYYGGGKLGDPLAGWKNTPMEKALRATIQAAADFIAAKTPSAYYRGGADDRFAPTPANPSDDPMERLTRLKAAFDAGLITEDDYETKKDEILRNF